MLLFIISMLRLSFIPYRSYEDENYLRPRTFRPNNNRRRQNAFSTFGEKQNNRHSNGQGLIVYVSLHFVLYRGITDEWMWWYKSTGNGNIVEHNINSDKTWRTLKLYLLNYRKQNPHTMFVCLLYVCVVCVCVCVCACNQSFYTEVKTNMELTFLN